MRKNHQIKTYDLEPVAKTSEASQEQYSSVSVDNSNEELEKKEEIIKRYNEEVAYEHEHAINSNPFMFRVNKSEKCNVHSIEDFRVKVKRKETRTLKEVLRTEEFRLSKRKKIIINAIKAWIKDFKENKSKVILKVSDVKEAVKPNDIEKIKVGVYIFLPLGLAVLIICYFGLTKLWSITKDFTLFGKEMHLNFEAARQVAFSSKWVNIVAVVGLYIAIASMLFIGLYHAICHEFTSYTKTHASLNEKLTNKVNSDFAKKSKKTLKYYQKALRKKECKLDPLPIEDTGITDVDFSDIEALSDAYTHKMAKMKGRKTFLYITKFILFKGTYLCASGVWGYVSFEIIWGLFGGGI